MEIHDNNFVRNANRQNANTGNRTGGGSTWQHNPQHRGGTLARGFDAPHQAADAMVNAAAKYDVPAILSLPFKAVGRDMNN